MSKVATKKEDELGKIRNSIDSIDDKILRLLKERTECVASAGRLKDLKKSKKSIIRPGREAEMVRRVSEKAKKPMKQVYQKQP